MAPLDVLQRVNSGWQGTSWSATFTALNAGDIILLFHVHDTGTSALTPPSGVTPLYDNIDGYPRLRIDARVIEAGDPLTWTYSTASPAATGGVIGYRIEGPFTDLSTIVVVNQAAGGTVGACDVLSAPTDIGAGTRLFAGVSIYGRNQSASFTGGFGNVQRIIQAGQLPSLAVADQLFADAAVDVQSSVTWTTGDTLQAADRKFFVAITAPVAGPSARKRRAVVGQEAGRRSKSHVANHRRATRNMLSAILSGSSITPSTLPPDYYTPRKPRVTFPPVLSPIVSFDP